jgi:PAS domain S-box-containing protein
VSQNRAVDREATPSWRLWLALATVASAYAAGVWVIGLSTQRQITATVWPAAGLSTLAVLVAPPGRRALMVAAVFVASAGANLTAGRPLLDSTLLGVCCAVEAALVAALTGRLIGRRIRSMQDVWTLFAIAAVGALVAGLGIAATAWSLMDGPFWRTLEVIGAAHAASVMILTPLALISWRRRHARTKELALQLSALAAATAVTFGPDSHVTLGFAALPLLMWAALRFDVWVVVLEQLAFATVVTVCTWNGWGPFNFYSDGGGTAGSTQLAQLYLICVALIGLPLAEAMWQRDRAVERLSASERVFRRSFTESRVPVVLVRLDHDRVTITSGNAAAATLLGCNADELLDRPLEEHLDAPEMLEALRRHGEDGATDWSGPLGLVWLPRVRIDGTLSVLEHSSSGTHFSLHLVDVTEPLELRERLEQERDYTRAVIDTATSMIVLTTVEGMVIAANPATTALTGYTEAELVGRPLWETLVPTERRDIVEEKFGDPDRLARVGETVLQTKSGGRLTLEFSNDVHQVTPDAPVTYVLSGTDVTAERENASMVDHLLRSATTTGFVGTDLDGTITLFNTGAERMLGLTAAEATGRWFADFVSADGASERGVFVHLVDQAAELGPETRECTWLPVGRTPLQVSMTTNPVTDSAGRLVGYLFVARDTSDTRRSQEILIQALRREREVVSRLKELDRARDEFVSTVSHELRTPMSSIIGGAEMLADGILGELEPAQQKMLDVISRNGDRLLALADDLLLLATFDHETWPEQSSRVDLRSVLAESGGSIGAMLATRDLDVDYAQPDAEVLVNGDATHLERAVTNLLTNAVKFTPDGGRISVSLAPDRTGRAAKLSVADTGLGIPRVELDQVFERFFRSSVVQEQAIQGSGLGLAIVKDIVESHDGRIDVRSEPGSGTTFTITLPLARPPSE